MVGVSRMDRFTRPVPEPFHATISSRTRLDRSGAISTIRPECRTSPRVSAPWAFTSQLSVRTSTSTHKAIILFTDGTDTSSKLDAAGVSALASSVGVPVYVVVAVPPVDQRTMIESSDSRASASGADLRQLADWTGGLLVFAANYAEMTVSAARVLDELRHQYVLAIEPARMPEWRRLEVRVRKTQAVIRARSGYFGG